MNIYQGLLFLHGFRIRPEDVIDSGSAADRRCGAAAPGTTPARVTGQGNVDRATPVAGAVD